MALRPCSCGSCSHPAKGGGRHIKALLLRREIYHRVAASGRYCVRAARGSNNLAGYATPHSPVPNSRSPLKPR